MKKFFTLCFLLCIFMQTMAYEWVDNNGMSWTFDLDGSNALNIQPTNRDNVSGTVTIPAKVYLWGNEYSVTNIAAHAFASCTGLYNAVISDGIQEISSGAFYGCPFMGSIVIPSSVNRIKYEAFYCNYALTKVIIYDLAAWCNINFDDNANPLSYAHHLYLYNEYNEVTNLTIPTGVTHVSSYAFHDCEGLTNVTISSHVTSIGEEAFKGCANLANVSIAESVTSVGEEAFTDTPFFNNLSGLVYLGSVAYKYVGTMPDNTEIVVNDGTVTIGPSAFSFCTNLKNITLPESLVTIEERAFQCCTGLTTVTIPDGVTSIGKFAFLDAGLTEVTIPDGVTNISESAFSRNEDLTSVTLPEGVEIISARAFNECAALVAVKIPSTVTSIGEEAFYGCSSLTNLLIPGNVEYIGRSAFEDCTGLTDLNMLEGVTTLDEYAFYGCRDLESVVIPASVTNINHCAFRQCTSLTNVYNFSPVPQTITEKAFSVYDGATLYVLDEYVDTYTTADIWKNFNIVGVIRGDVNLDHSVDVADFMAVANYILNNPVEVFHAPLADVGGNADGSLDGKIDVSDFMGIANIILHKTASQGVVPKQAAAKSPRKAATDIDALADAIYVEPVTAAPGTRQVLSVQMKNSGEVSAFEFNLYLPDGITVASEDGILLAGLSNERTTDKKTSYFGSSVQPDGSLRVLCGTTAMNEATGKPWAFEGNAGEVARITVEVPADYEEGVYEMSITDAKTSDNDGIKTLMDDMEGNMDVGNNQTTGISLTPNPSIPSDARPPIAFPKGEGSGYYTLDGQKFDKKPSKKGVYIYNGKIIVVK